jgi:hypothetical protein
MSSLPNTFQRACARAVVLLATSVLLTVCGGGGGGDGKSTVSGGTATVTVTSPVEKIYEGDTVQLVATARDAAGNVLLGKTVTWSSGDEELFPVSDTGVLKTWAYGPVIVAAQIDGVSGSLSLTIDPIKISVAVGAKEVIFDYTTDRCYDGDLLDQPARFVRAEDGSLVLIDGSPPRHYISRGADFGSLKRDCTQPALVSADLRTPESYENQEWLWAVYREGNRWHALVHNEFHDPVASTCRPGDPTPNNPCWYNSITYALSTDDARSFAKPFAPAHVVAPAPNFWVPPSSPVPIGQWAVEGYFAPTNIVRANDGYYYALLTAMIRNSSPAGLCAIRTDTLDDPASWRAWDGSGFNLRMTSPYVTGSPAPLCTFLKTEMVSGHLVYNTYLGRYMNVIQGVTWIGERLVCGIYFSLSADLIHWSAQQLLVEAKTGLCNDFPQEPGMIEPVMVGYSSIVDHADTTVNFEKAGRTPYLYYTRFNDGLDWDLVRVPLTFTRLN